jgi:hypothetical protein
MSLGYHRERGESAALHQGRYTKGQNEQSLIADEKTRDAVERCLQRISEAAMRLGEENAGQLVPAFADREPSAPRLRFPRWQ